MRRERADYMILSACAVIFLVMIFPLRGSMTDDTFIHMQYARHLAEDGELSFNRGDPTYGATSPLWVFLLALVHKVGGDMAAWSRILSQFFGFASVLLVYRIVMRIDGRRFTAGAAALVMSCEAWLVRWSTVGMETSFSVFMIAAVLMTSLSASRSTVRSLLFGALLFLSYLTRPETLLIAPIFIFAFLAAGEGAPLRNRSIWLVSFLLCLLVWFPSIKAHTGTYFPLTAGAKQGSIVFSAELLRRATVPARILGSSMALPLAAVIAALVFRAAGSREILGPAGRGMGAGVLAGLIWIFALPAVFVVMDFQVLSRYMILVSPAVIAIGMVAAVRIAGKVIRSDGARRTAVCLLVAVAMAQNVLLYSLVIVRPTREFSEGLSGVISEIGMYLARNADPGAVVAAPDIGAVGYYSGLRVLDLGGLVTPEINRMRRDMDVEKIIDEGLYLDLGADYLMDRSTEGMRFSGRVIRGSRFEPLMSGVVKNLGIRNQVPVTYALYRIEPVEGEGP
ncbi:MAG TPA: glycosyltransferase family 39 protein [Candidatus Krumholzibacterium sp.]|nr:glycosyltransferase family 39 protein [Candidatus Krumholzibacterium sp.]